TVYPKGDEEMEERAVYEEERVRLAERVRELENKITILKNALEFYAYTKPVCAVIIDGTYTESYKDHGEIARQALAALEGGGN
ncbi:MAG: hypothetical protein AB7E08_05730, partial [Candidatus Omnitrophota bacterium]